MKMDDIIALGRGWYGEQFDASDLAPAFATFYGTDARIRVTRYASTDAEYTRTGTVGITTGWRPAFRLMHRSSDLGSSDVLSARDTITHVRLGRTYVPVTVFPNGTWQTARVARS